MNAHFDIRFKWIGSATWILCVDTLTIACDPVLCPEGTIQVHAPFFNSKRLIGPVYDATDFDAIDLWLISHEHLDHLDDDGLEKIDPAAHIIANKKAKKKLMVNNPQRLALLGWGQTVSYEIKGLAVSITGMPAVHGSNAIMASILGGGNGYWVTIRNDDDTLNLYVTGDTVTHKTVLSPLKGAKADILIPNIGAPFANAFGGPFTFTTESIRPVVDMVNPDVILPVHYGTFSHFHESAETVTRWDMPNVTVCNEGEWVHL